jgi:DNA-binding CsgD family transcriptional regulator
VALLADAAAFDIVHADKLHARSSSRRTASEGDFAATTGTVIVRNGTRTLAIEIRYADAREGEAKARAAALLRHIAPHLARAIELARRERGRDAAELEDVVDALPFGIFFIDGGLHIHYANRRADEVRRKGHGPFTAFDARLRAPDAEADALLRDAISRAEHGPRTGSALNLSGPDGRRYYLTARLLRPRDRRLQLHDALYDAGPRLLIAVHEADQPIQVPTDFLWRSFALTDAEAKLADALVNGLTLAELAHDRGLSKQTLRNQLVGLMRKTGTKRQSQLVALLTRLSLGAL